MGSFAAVKRYLGPADAMRDWLLKARTSSGGRGVAAASQRIRIRGHYFQKRLRGDAVSGVFVGTPERCRFIGASRQLVGEDWLHAESFQYCGSIGPLAISNSLREKWEAIGHTLWSAAPLRGVFGVDAIATTAGPVAVEVNPRYPASAEVFELACGELIVAEHLEAFGERCSVPAVRTAGGIIGKAVYFAPRSFSFPPSGPWDDELEQDMDLWRVPRFADVPWPKTTMRQGEPVLSVLTCGANLADCLRSLRLAARRLDGLFDRPRPKSPGRPRDISG